MAVPGLTKIFWLRAAISNFNDRQNHDHVERIQGLKKEAFLSNPEISDLSNIMRAVHDRLDNISREQGVVPACMVALQGFLEADDASSKLFYQNSVNVYKDSLVDFILNHAEILRDYAQHRQTSEEVLLILDCLETYFVDQTQYQSEFHHQQTVAQLIVQVEENLNKLPTGVVVNFLTGKPREPGQPQ